MRHDAASKRLGGVPAMRCPKAEALTRMETSIMEVTHLTRLHGKEAESIVEALLFCYEFIKEAQCPGSAHISKGM